MLIFTALRQHPHPILLTNKSKSATTNSSHFHLSTCLFHLSLDYHVPVALPNSKLQMNPPHLLEPASPITPRPPPANLGEFLSGGSGLQADDDAGGSGGGGNRWPRQETLELLRIRSEMDATFRDATLKGPLWEDVSRKLGEVGFKRSAKKCKEKFENVHKYYKRTKDGRAGRQDGKSYRFFSELEALHASTPPADVSPAPPATANVNVFVSAPPINPTPISSIRFTPTYPMSDMFAIGGSTAAPAVPDPDEGGAGSFSTNTASTCPMSDEEEEEYNVSSSNRKRKRTTKKMMEGLMKQVMQKQEAMQQRFLEAVEKREQERLIREEAWRRQEMARLSREHDLMAQERAVSSSRDAAIISFLQKITGQLPPQLNINPPLPPPQLPIPAPPQQPQKPQQRHRPQPPSADGRMEGASPSRWPKTEVLALINLRSGLEAKYEEAGPKGPLWEEISAGMKKMGYNRNSKRCKEKWENINKYFKKVKESSKKRPEDAKTCPYFHQLDALYRNKTNSTFATSQQGFKLDPIRPPQLPTDHPQNKNGDEPNVTDLFGEPTANKPEDIVKEMMAQQQQVGQQLMVDEYDKIEEGESEEIEDDEDDDEEEVRKMDYKIEFQRQNTSTGPSNGGGNGASSFLSLVQ